MAIPIQHFTFHSRWTSEARLPDFLGSALRGAFGWALKKSSCALKNQECATCILCQRCAYAWVFETERYTDNAGCNVNARPHPFVLQPGEGTNGFREAGEHWTFSLLLIGRGIDFLPHIVYSVQLMGATGIGAGAKQGLGRFSLEKILIGKTLVYDSDGGLLDRNKTSATLTLNEPPSSDPVTALQVTLRTPLRLKQDNRLQRNLPFHILVRAALRRIAALETAYGKGEPALDYAGLVHRAEQIATDESSIRWQEMMRFSNRQRKKISLGGLVGTVKYSGDLTDFLPLLDYAQRVNLGKQTVFGLGSFSCHPIPLNNSTRTVNLTKQEQNVWIQPH